MVGTDHGISTKSSCRSTDRCSPLWVISGHRPADQRCPLCPRKQTCAASKSMSALCQKRTFASSLRASPQAGHSTHLIKINSRLLSFCKVRRVLRRNEGDPREQRNEENTWLCALGWRNDDRVRCWLFSRRRRPPRKRNRRVPCTVTHGR